MSDHLFELVVGAYIFAAGAYVFAFKIYSTLMGIRKIVTNHHEHDLNDLRSRVARLEDR